jgi:hypothetical protein
MILWQFVVLMVFLVVCEWAAEQRNSKRNEKLERLLNQLSHIENRLNPIADLPADIARAIYREGENRRDYFLATGKEKP